MRASDPYLAMFASGTGTEAESGFVADVSGFDRDAWFTPVVVNESVAGTYINSLVNKVTLTSDGCEHY